MDMSKNFIPDNVRRVHLMAVCGTAMGALACMLKDVGYEVSGWGRWPACSRTLATRSAAPIRRSTRR
jgi:UDP-N-acetylmuramate: L-alanyl-gamma-D-glutamyl-meso-diaminopimelate ligase